MTMHGSQGRGQGEEQGGVGRGEVETEKGRGSESIQKEEQGAGGQRSSLNAPQGKLVFKIICTQTCPPCYLPINAQLYTSISYLIFSFVIFCDITDITYFSIRTVTLELEN